jgi:hypothetical protein
VVRPAWSRGRRGAPPPTGAHLLQPGRTAAGAQGPPAFPWRRVEAPEAGTCALLSARVAGDVGHGGQWHETWRPMGPGGRRPVEVREIETFFCVQEIQMHFCDYCEMIVRLQDV